MVKNIKNKHQSGAVSLFVVVFAALLITIVTVSFIRIMLQDQRQASLTDFSQSAYDSAQAGVEDAKRALLRHQDICNGTDVAACEAATKAINSTECNVAVKTLKDVTSSDNGVKIQTNTANLLDQAYTCVKISLNTPDYLGVLTANKSKIVPLYSESSFNTVRVEWFSTEDLGSDGDSKVKLDPISVDSPPPLLDQNSWNAADANRPSIMRTQLIQFGSEGFTLDSFDDKNAADQSNANTLFLYPIGNTGITHTSIASRDLAVQDVRRTPTGEPEPVTCSGVLGGGGYACRVDLRLPAPIDGGDRTAFLRVSALYNATHYKLTLLNSSTPVEFKAVQPAIDSTGRASDLFRRVSSRVELIDPNFPYPEAAVDVTGSFCKEFAVTDNTADYVSLNAGDSCKP